ncbi:MAG: hypothetical protein HKN08_03240 [Gammaproteobacteria bacterium]|nr:hypothetical protein [Gammaproteobacteria bacterium]
MTISGRQSLIILISVASVFCAPISADEERTDNQGVLNQKPYSSNQFPDNTIVIQSEKHGRGTFNNYPSYGHQNRPFRQRNHYRRPTDRSRIYTSPQPSVSYYYSTPKTHGSYVQIQSRQGIYNNPQRSGHYNRRSPASRNSYNVTPNHNFKNFQQYRSQPYYPQPQYRQHGQQNIDRRPNSCLGPDCGK